MGVQPTDASPGAGPFFRVTLVGLVIIGLGHVLASWWGVPLAFAALGGSLLLLLGALWSGGVDWRRLGREISWLLFVFVGGMFLLVRGIADLGATAPIGHALVALAQSQPSPAILVTSAGTALGANLINNVPMALVMVSALQSVLCTGCSRSCAQSPCGDRLRRWIGHSQLTNAKLPDSRKVLRYISLPPS